MPSKTTTKVLQILLTKSTDWYEFFFTLLVYCMVDVSLRNVQLFHFTLDSFYWFLDFPPQTQELISKFASLDMQLYNAALDIFWRRVAVMEAVVGERFFDLPGTFHTEDPSANLLLFGHAQLNKSTCKGFFFFDKARFFSSIEIVS